MFQGATTKPWFSHIAQTLPGHKILVRGNHDYPKKFTEEYWLQDCGFEKVYDDHLVLGNVLFSHFPITRNPEDNRCLKLIEHLNRAFVFTNCDYNVHGHVHSYKVPDSRCICACPEQTDHKPINVRSFFTDLTEVKNLMESF